MFACDFMVMFHKRTFHVFTETMHTVCEEFWLHDVNTIFNLVSKCLRDLNRRSASYDKAFEFI